MPPSIKSEKMMRGSNLFIITQFGLAVGGWHRSIVARWRARSHRMHVAGRGGDVRFDLDGSSFVGALGLIRPAGRWRCYVAFVSGLTKLYVQY